jgi:hypothetical protein
MAVVVERQRMAAALEGLEVAEEELTMAQSDRDRVVWGRTRRGAREAAARIMVDMTDVVTTWC